MLGLLKQLHPRGMVVMASAILMLAGMAALLTWLETLPPREQVLHLAGQLRELKLKDARTGTFELTLLAADGTLRTFDFDHAHRLVALLESGELGQSAAVALEYFEVGRKPTVVDVVVGKERVLGYEDATRLAAEKAEKSRNSAIGLGAVGALVIFLGGLARLARGSRQQAAAPNPDLTVAALCWLVLYGAVLVAVLTEPTILHRAWGAEAFGLPIEYMVLPALALLFLPLWPGCVGLGSLMRRAIGKGRGGTVGLLSEWRSAAASSDPVERRTAIKALWFFAYFVSVVAAWIAYATMLGI